MDLYRYRDDKALLKTFAAVEKDARLTVDLSLMQELDNLSAYSKSMRDISAARYKTREDLHGLAKPYEEVQYYRGRVLRIKTGHLPVLRILKRMWSACVSALYQYDEIVKLSPVARREAALGTILEPLRSRIDDCELIIDTATEVEKLLGNAYFTLRELRGINEAFLYEHKRERGL